MAVGEEDDEVHLKVDLEGACDNRRAREEPREDHVNRDRPAVADRAIGDLDVLDLGGLSGEAVLVGACFDTHKLQLDRLDSGRAFLYDDLPGQGQGNVAYRRVDLPADLECWHMVEGALAHILERFRHDGEGCRVELGLLGIGRLEDELNRTLDVLAQHATAHLYCHHILDVYEDAMIRLQELLAHSRFELDLKFELDATIRKFSWGLKIARVHEQLDGLDGRVECFKQAHALCR
mmetsp:Transcript_15162/g.39163  ORF Transcript_15162/g.39163 Transcript_15162/m.39163 type:complete len:235 (-) Transcript_15162:192-896(-)